MGTSQKLTKNITLINNIRHNLIMKITKNDLKTFTISCFANDIEQLYYYYYYYYYTGFDYCR